MTQQVTRIVPVTINDPEPSLIAEGAALLRQGELVIFPTETVYGLGADAFNVQAVAAIFAAKGRPYSDPLIVHIADVNDINHLVTSIPETANKLIEAFWPGPLTLILPAHPSVPGLVTAGLPNVAIRMPQHPIAQALIKASGRAIAAPSANRFMHVSPTTAQHAFQDLQGKVPLILDGGPCTVGVESTVLNLCTDPPTILRPGGTSLEALQRVIPAIQTQSHSTQAEDGKESSAQVSPGQMLIHYAPRVPAILFEGSEQAMHTALRTEIARRQSEGEKVGLLITNEDVAALQDSGANIYILGTTPEQIASRLFAGLRVLEDAGVQIILTRSFTHEGLGLAIQDRLVKASGGNIIRC